VERGSVIDNQEQKIDGRIKVWVTVKKKDGTKERLFYYWDEASKQQKYYDNLYKNHPPCPL